jgi:hypothetical protein
MKFTVCDLSALKTKDETYVRFVVRFSSDAGEVLMHSAGWTLNRYRDVQPPATKTARGFYKRFTEISSVFETLLLQALERFPEVEEILGPKLKRISSAKTVIEGEVEIPEPSPSRKRRKPRQEPSSN